VKQIWRSSKTRRDWNTGGSLSELGIPHCPPAQGQFMGWGELLFSSGWGGSIAEIDFLLFKPYRETSESWHG